MRRLRLRLERQRRKAAALPERAITFGTGSGGGLRGSAATGWIGVAVEAGSLGSLLLAKDALRCDALAAAGGAGRTAQGFCRLDGGDTWRVEGLGLTGEG